MVRYITIGHKQAINPLAHSKTTEQSKTASEILLSIVEYTMIVIRMSANPASAIEIFNSMEISL